MIDPLAFASIDWDCFGCVQQALRDHVIDQETYDDYFATLKAMEEEQWGTCPGCGKRGHISQMFETMHCPECGLYSAPDGKGGWKPFRQGLPMPDMAGVLARRAARRTKHNQQQELDDGAATARPDPSGEPRDP